MDDYEDYRAQARELGLVMLDREPRDGEMYLAKRNTGFHLLTCKSVDVRHWVNPVEHAYCYDTWECRTVAAA